MKQKIICANVECLYNQYNKCTQSILSIDKEGSCVLKRNDSNYYTRQQKPPSDPDKQFYPNTNIC